MYKNKRILAIIPARGGSKGIPNKNIRIIKGKPLIFYTIDAAIKSKCIDSIVVSTDSDKIAKIAKKYGANVPFLRPKELAGDKSKTIDCVIYTINKLKEQKLKYDILILLQPTSPLRTSEDIKNALELFSKTKKSVSSVNEIDINPLLYRSIDNKNKLTKLLNVSSTMRRQDLPKYYKVNGAIYINDINKLSLESSLNDNEVGYVMEVNNSIDIDTNKDLSKAKLIIKRR